MWASIPGFRYSSTRTEIAAGIVALFACGPIHQASDNLSFVRYANYLIEHGDQATHKPWQLMRDGDLWEAYFNLLLQKGCHAVKVSWVKAHTTQEDVQKGITTQARHEGNTRADDLANQGVVQGQEYLVELSKIYHRRHTQYTRFVKDMHDVILRVTRAHRDRRRIANLEAAGGLLGCNRTTIVAASQWQYPSIPEGRRVHLRPLPSDMDNNILVQQIWHFINNLIIKPTGDTGAGVAWIELLAKFEHDGGCVQIQGGGKIIRASFRAIFLLFKRKVKQVVSICADADDHILFTP